MIRKTNFHYAYQGNFSEYNWPLNTSVERPGHSKILHKALTEQAVQHLSGV